MGAGIAPPMNRRAFVTGLGAVLAAPVAAEAQETKVWRIGYLTPTRAVVRPTLDAALRERGYIQGKTITIEFRAADNDLDRLPLLAADLVRSRVDVIVAVSHSAILAARKTTFTIPIVMAFLGGEGVAESGIVQSFANPGGNITGVYLLAAELDAKRLELLLQAVPNAHTVGVLYPAKGWSYLAVRQVAQANGVHLHVTDIPSANGYEHVFDTLVKANVDALLVPGSPRFSRERAVIIDAAAKRRIPAVYEWGDMARAEDSWRMGRCSQSWIDKSPPSSTVSSGAPSLPTFPSSSPRSSSSSSTSRPPRRSASRSLPRCCCGRIR